MNNPQPFESKMSAEQLASVRDALARNAAETGPMDLLQGGIQSKNGRWFVPVRRQEEKTSAFKYFHAVASAEQELNDQGLDVYLDPEFIQQFVVVATLNGGNKYVYTSTAGQEYEDLATLLHKDFKLPETTVEIEGYPYDTDEELKTAYAEAKKEYPTAEPLGSFAG